MRWDRFARMLIAGIALALPLTIASAGDAARGRGLAYSCMGCHGIKDYKNAYPKYSVPRLGGQSEVYIVAALEAYANGSRWHPTMQGQASTLSKEDRADLAAWFASIPHAEPAAANDAEFPEKAETCAACHGRGGAGTMDEYPDIGGQHADYLAQALNDYRTGKRKHPIMGSFAQQLTREEIEQLAEYFSRQQGLSDPELD